MTKIFAKGALLGLLSALFVMLTCQVALAQSFCADLFLDPSVVVSSRAVFQKVEGLQADLMMAPVTQGLWQKVSALSLKNSNGLRINPDMQTFLIKDDGRAVSDVAPSFVALWIRALNELSLKGEPELARLFVGHKMGDRYRLPTETELAQQKDQALNGALWMLTQDSYQGLNYITVRKEKDARMGVYRYANAPVGLRLVREED